jgi:hypothetical protein
MAIGIRNDWFGIPAHASFDNVNEALTYIKNNPSYEVITDDKKVRPYGDIDYYPPSDISEFEFHKLDAQIYCQFTELFESINRKICLTTATSYDEKKISWRWYVPDTYVDSHKHAKIFAEKVYSQIELPNGIKPDYSVYCNNKKMRMVGTWKPNSTRHFTIQSGELGDTIITYIPTDAEHIPIELPVQPERKPAEQIESSRLTAACDNIKVEHFADYKSCLQIIWGLCSSGATPDLIHHYCKQAHNYGEKWVDDAIRNWNSSKSPSFATVMHYVEDKSKVPRDANAVIPKQDPTPFLKEITQLTTDHTTLFNWNTSRGFLKQLPVHSTLAVKSHMGTGKTREMIRICHQAIAEKKSVCILSVRRSWATTIHAELPEFVDYRDVKEKHIPASTNIIIQLQSIHRLEGNVYDYVLFDESESLLATLSPNQTHGKKFIHNMQTFESIVKQAKYLIALDAFLTDRTVSLLQVLRGEVQIVVNPTIPYKRKGVIYQSETEYHSQLRNRLKQGKRIISLWGKKDHAIAYHKRTPEDITNVLYHKDTNEKLKQQHFGNVNKYWGEYQHVAYTTTVTVGLNYTAEPLFDQCSFYASAYSCVSRDVIQALHRARALKDDFIFGYVDARGKPMGAIDAGLENQAIYFNEVSERKRRFLESIGEKLDSYEELPTWLKNLLIWNRNELVINSKYFRESMELYLALSGVEVVAEGEADKKESLKDKKCIPDFEMIEDITHEQAEMYRHNQKTLTEDEKYALEKYYLRDRVIYINQEIWEMWVHNRVWVNRTYLQMNSSASFELSRADKKIAELVSNDVEKLKAVQTFDFDFSKSWTIPVDELKQVSLECFNLRKRTDKDTPEQYARDVSKALKSWNGTNLKIVSKRVRIESGRGYSYCVEYDVDENPIYSAIITRKAIFEDDPI